MRLARLLRGAAAAGSGPGLRAAGPRDRRSLASDSGSGPASESGVPGQVDFYARFSPSPLSMKQFLDFGESGAGLRPLCAARAGGWGRRRPRSALSSLTSPRSAPWVLPSSLAGAALTARVNGAWGFSLRAGKQTRRVAGGMPPRLPAHVCCAPGAGSLRSCSGESRGVDASGNRLRIPPRNAPLAHDDCTGLGKGKQVRAGPVFSWNVFLAGG